MIGAVSPAVAADDLEDDAGENPADGVRQHHLVRIVCQRVAPMFQQASRKAMCGTALQRLARRDDDHRQGHDGQRQARRRECWRRSSEEQDTKAPTPNSACTIDGTPARLTIARLITRVSQLSGRVFAEVNRRRRRRCGSAKRASATATSARRCRPARGRCRPRSCPVRAGSVKRKSHRERLGPALDHQHAENAACTGTISSNGHQAEEHLAEQPAFEDGPRSSLRVV